MNPNSSAHFVIAKDGRITQLVSLDDSSWTNGLRIVDGKWFTPADPPRPENPTWPDIISGVNPNWYTISIEHEGDYHEQWTPEMYASNTRLLRWIASSLGLAQESGAPFQYVPHRTLIGHWAIDPVDRANCPGPNVDYERMAADANGVRFLDKVVPEVASRHVYATTALVSLPNYNVVAHLTDTDVAEAGYLDYQGTRWYISRYSRQISVPNFFDSAATQVPIRDLTPSLALSPGYREAVTPSVDELRALRPRWLRVPLLQRYQDFDSDRNSELDWLLDRIQGMGINLLILLGPQTIGQAPPASGTKDWGNQNSGFIGRVSSLAKNIAAFYQDRIGAMEIWIEPDVQKMAPEDYGALLAATYSKIKAVSGTQVISAGIGGEDSDYLRRVAAVARGSFDGVGCRLFEERVDGYPSPAFGVGEMRYALCALRAIGGKPLWITELGARLDYNWGGTLTPADAVASYLTRAYSLLRALGRNTVAQAFWYTWRSPDGVADLVDKTGARRPAWYAFQQQISQPKT